MTRIRTKVLVGLVGLASLGAVVRAQNAAPTMDTLKGQLQQALARAEAAEAQRDALTGQAVALRHQVDQMAAQLVPACVTAVEEGNPGKTVNPEHRFAIEDKAAPAPDKK